MPVVTIGQMIDPGMMADLVYPPSDSIPSPVFTDPNITYGPGSGAPGAGPSVPFGPQPTPETIAINQLVAAGYMRDPNLPGTTTAVSPQGLPPGPAPRVNVPLSTKSFGQFFTGSTLLAGIPNWAVLSGVLIGTSIVAGMLGGGGGRRRR